ncbi:hypothetical protein EP7_001150 [Isosphaeraceae bacterium EP7]
MTEEEWLRSDDAAGMLLWLRANWPGDEANLDRLVKKYCLACCRRIWKLLPHINSRKGIKVTRRFLEGTAALEEFERASWDAEGAYFEISYGTNPGKLARWQKQVGEISPDQIRLLTNPVARGDEIVTKDLLTHAAYFAYLATCFHGRKSQYPYRLFNAFMPAPMLRDLIDNPFRLETTSK